MLSIWAGLALACGGLVHSEGTLAEGEANEVLIDVGVSSVTVTYEVAYTGDASDFGWIVPVSGEFYSIEDADPDVFDVLSLVTRPQVVTHSSHMSGCGCPGASPGGLREDGNAEVEVVAEGFTGSYDYTVVSAASAADLDTWLADNGWTLGSLGDAVDHYIDDGADFVALRVSPDAPADDDMTSLPPVSIAYLGTDAVYPAMMLEASEELQRTTIYVRAAERVDVTGWTSLALEDVTGQPGQEATEVWEGLLHARGNQTEYILTWAGDDPEGGEGWVTRFDTLAPGSAHVADAVFTPAESSEYHETTINLEEDGENAALFLPLLGLIFGWRRRRRG